MDTECLVVTVALQRRKIKERCEGVIERQFIGKKGLECRAEISYVGTEEFERNSIGMQKRAEREEFQRHGIALPDLLNAKGKCGGNRGGMTGGEISSVLQELRFMFFVAFDIDSQAACRLLDIGSGLVKGQRES